jgi:hypothetical protein
MRARSSGRLMNCCQSVYICIRKQSGVFIYAASLSRRTRGTAATRFQRRLSCSGATVMQWQFVFHRRPAAPQAQGDTTPVWCSAAQYMRTCASYLTPRVHLRGFLCLAYPVRTLLIRATLAAVALCGSAAAQLAPQSQQRRMQQPAGSTATSQQYGTSAACQGVRVLSTLSWEWCTGLWCGAGHSACDNRPAVQVAAGRLQGQGLPVAVRL